MHDLDQPAEGDGGEQPMQETNAYYMLINPGLISVGGSIDDRAVPVLCRLEEELSAQAKEAIGGMTDC